MNLKMISLKPFGEVTLYNKGSPKTFAGTVVDHAKRIIEQDAYKKEGKVDLTGEWYFIENGRKVDVDPSNVITSVCQFLDSFGGHKILSHFVWKPGEGDFLVCETVPE